MQQLQDFCKDARLGKVATVMGRFYAMDRDNRWDRIEKAYHAIVSGEAENRFRDPIQYVRAQYDQGVTDEFLVPAVAEKFPGVKDGDGVIFFNFRADRAREITRAMTQADFPNFRRKDFPRLAGFVCMSPYEESFHLPAAYEKPKVPKTLGEVVSLKGWKQLRIAETEKYAHVTYFFNGGEEKVFSGGKKGFDPLSARGKDL